MRVTTPEAMAIATPHTQLPVLSAPQIPKKAPISIMPSSPMFTTPERSENIPPIAANVSGVAKTSIDAIRLAVKTWSRWPCSSDGEQSEPDPDKARGDRAEADAARTAARRPDPGGDREDSDEDRPQKRARRQRRQREPRGEGAKEDPERTDPAWLREP